MKIKSLEEREPRVNITNNINCYGIYQSTFAGAHMKEKLNLIISMLKSINPRAICY